MMRGAAESGPLDALTISICAGGAERFAAWIWVVAAA